jgi:hypothetical protein
MLLHSASTDGVTMEVNYMWLKGNDQLVAVVDYAYFLRKQNYPTIYLSYYAVLKLQ